MPTRSNAARPVPETTEAGTKTMKSRKTPKPPAEIVPPYVPDIPEPTSRAELMKYWMNLSLDDKTANKMLWIDKGGSKVVRRKEEVCPVLDRPERYEYSPQVVCKEGIWNARGYWEVSCSGWVVVGAAYEEAVRRASDVPSGLGENEQSWGLCWAGTRYQVWIKGTCEDIRDVPFTSTLGFYVDQPAGILSFYAVSGEGEEREVTLIYKVEGPLEKRILPGFWVGMQSSCELLKKTQ